MKKGLILVLLIAVSLFTFAQETENYTDANGLKQGYWDETTGHMTSKGHYLDNLKDGSWVNYHNNGMVNSVISYIKGKKNGTAIFIDQRAYLKYEQNYKNDILDGAYKEYAPGGRMKKELNYKDGKLHGAKKIYYDNGRVQEESFYVDGQKDGIAKWYSQNGKLVAEFYYKMGIFDGTQKAYYNTGELMSEGFYTNNKKEALYKEYYIDGTVKLEGQYERDLKTGEWNEYSEDGKLIKLTVYKKGEVKKEKSYI